MRRITLPILIAIVFSTSAKAETYKVSLTRKDQDFYQVSFGKIFVRTKYCYEYAYGEDAIIDTEKREVIFLGSRPTKCDLDMILQQIG